MEEIVPPEYIIRGLVDIIVEYSPSLYFIFLQLDLVESSIINK